MKNSNINKGTIYSFIKNILHVPVITWGFDIITVLKSRIILDFRKPVPVFIPVCRLRKK